MVHMFFIDESGSIPKHCSKRYKHRYFVIGFVHTQDPKKLKNTYKRALKHLRKYFPDHFLNCDDPNEMKGSECPPFMKYYILEKLITLTDIKIGHMVVDTWNIKDVFRLYPDRSFNYLVKLMIEHFPISDLDKKQMIIRIDNRNSAIPSLKSLEEYLFKELVLNKGYLDEVKVDYLDSKHNYNIQIADVVANTVYQHYRYRTMPFPNFAQIKKADDKIYFKSHSFIYDLIQPALIKPFEFPLTPAITK
ncbi:MAG TPA: DUF3800 domain-containing protein [Bacillales bacterium]|nr:DUF3800 domain-containing protein [Bacillales bacterium]